MWAWQRVWHDGARLRRVLGAHCRHTGRRPPNARPPPTRHPPLYPLNPIKFTHTPTSTASTTFTTSGTLYTPPHNHPPTPRHKHTTHPPVLNVEPHLGEAQPLQALAARAHQAAGGLAPGQRRKLGGNHDPALGAGLSHELVHELLAVPKTVPARTQEHVQKAKGEEGRLGSERRRCWLALWGRLAAGGREAPKGGVRGPVRPGGPSVPPSRTLRRCPGNRFRSQSLPCTPAEGEAAAAGGWERPAGY
jgi:hypothetical protein